MQKIILTIVGLILLTLIFFTQCTEEKKVKNKQTPKKEIKVKVKEIVTQKISTSSQEKQPITPFKPSMEVNINQNETIAENLEELENEAFKTIQPKIAQAMQKIPECLENAETKEEAFSCSQKLRDLNKELAMAMGDFSEEGIEAYDKDFEWNEETKINMIQEIEAGTQAMQEMQACMEASTSTEELDKCLKPNDLNPNEIK